MIHKVEVATKARVEFVNITRTIQELVHSSGLENGLCTMYVPHTTAALTINEGADPSVVQDIIAQLDTMVPQHNRYRHLEGNSPAHIKASLMGSSETVMVESGELLLGTWQAIFFCEFDGPRRRKLFVRIVPDSSQ